MQNSATASGSAGPAVPLELVDAGIVLGGGGGERGGGHVVGGALGCQFPAPAGLGGRVLLGGLSVRRAGAVELPFKAA